MKKDSRKTGNAGTGKAGTGQTGADSKGPENESESFGAWLSRQRSVRGIKLEEIAESSKISLQYLKAFEADRFDMLPADVFAKGFLRQYAGYVGLDPEEVINFYLTASQDDDDDEVPDPRPKGASAGSTGRLVFFSVVVIALLVALVWWLSQRGNFPAVGTTTTQTGAVEPSANQEPQASTQPAAAEPAAETSLPAPSAAPTTVGAVDASAATSGNASPTATTNSPVEPSTPVAAGSETMQVVAEFSDSCWVEAQVDGERRVSMTKVQGESLILEAEEAVEFKFGNVTAVRLEVNGTAFPLTPRPGRSTLEVRIDRSVLASSTPSTTGSPGTGGTTP